ncbi:hypothetical protein HN011_000113 [Eciton burchellii]|nr:hypothetical protein HN011_000113 [Eciton burchellii]
MHTEKDVKPVRDDARAASTVNNERDRVDFRVRFSCHDGHRAPILNAAATREILILSRALLRAKCLTERQNITKRRRRTNDERGDECQAGMTRMRLVLRRKQATRNMERLSVENLNDLRLSCIFVSIPRNLRIDFNLISIRISSPRVNFESGNASSQTLLECFRRINIVSKSAD